MNELPDEELYRLAFKWIMLNDMGEILRTCEEIPYTPDDFAPREPFYD